MVLLLQAKAVFLSQHGGSYGYGGMLDQLYPCEVSQEWWKVHSSDHSKIRGSRHSKQQAHQASCLRGDLLMSATDAPTSMHTLPAAVCATPITTSKGPCQSTSSAEPPCCPVCLCLGSRLVVA
eukprot:GHUV01034752.1.p1 GENE.GHUV01034752.1~~GHUV01034752.1.p1  ORF type:complete len:123 (+),score=22.22 GHUV01034752.1:357-725(+)